MAKKIAFIFGAEGRNIFSPVCSSTTNSIAHSVVMLQMNSCDSIYVALNHLDMPIKKAAEEFVQAYVSAFKKHVKEKIIVSASDTHYVAAFIGFLRQLGEDVYVNIFAKQAETAFVISAISAECTVADVQCCGESATLLIKAN